MSRENPINRVLVLGGNQALLAAGSRPDALNNGQLGVFNYHTGLSVDGSDVTQTKDIFLALGINRTLGGTNVAEDIFRSAGQFIQARRIKSLTMKGANDEVPKIQDVSGYIALCDSDYILHVEFRSRKLYGIYGFNNPAKSYFYHSDPCTPSQDCTDCNKAGDPALIAKGLITAINIDKDALLVATARVNISGVTVGGATSSGTITITVGNEVFSVAVASSDTGTQVAAKIVAVVKAATTSAYFAANTGAALSVFSKVAGAVPVITLTSAGGTAVAFSGSTTSVDTAIADIDAFRLANPGVAPVIRITASVEARAKFVGSLPIKYYLAGVDFYTVGKGDLTNNITVTDKQALRYRAGDGTDIQFLEYMAAGWGVVGPYRQSAITGLAKETIEYFSVVGSKYIIVDINGELESSAGWENYDNDNSTTIVIPCADSTTLTSLATIFDLIFTQFGGMTDDKANVSCTSAATSTFTPPTDGIESLA